MTELHDTVGIYAAACSAQCVRLSGDVDRVSADAAVQYYHQLVPVSLTDLPAAYFMFSEANRRRFFRGMALRLHAGRSAALAVQPIRRNFPPLSTVQACSRSAYLADVAGLE
jgi:hypothetical protein